MVQVDEYRACFDLVNASLGRQLQGLTITGALYAAVGFVVSDVYVDDSARTALKLAVLYSAVAALSGLNAIAAVVFNYERFVQRMAVRRMVDLEVGTDWMLTRQMFSAMAREWRSDNPSEIYTSLPAREQARLTQETFGLIPAFRPQFMPYLLWLLLAAEFILIALLVVGSMAAGNLL